jgi:23S rRNA pseudouridine2605 synthase
VRVNQYVAAASGLSRRAADTAIAAGRVSIDGQTAKLGDQAAEGAEIRLDGQPIIPVADHTYIMLHKPAGYVSSRVRQGNDPTLYELMPTSHHHLRTVGRLDRDSSGLILLSDDGNFIHRLTHPSFAKDKIYELTLARPLSVSDRKRLELGVKLTDGPSRVQVLATSGRTVTVSLSEGRNRQLRRTFGAIGYTIVRLHRIQMGPYRLDDLASGHWQSITREDQS